MIDAEGYRYGVGIVLVNAIGDVFWARRVGQDAWQFAQGGMQESETAEESMYRELKEELGLLQQDVQLLASGNDWISYRLPSYLVRHHSKPVCIGQKQKWFLLRLLSDDNQIQLDQNKKPEFDDWTWVPFWYPVRHVVSFKQEVYQQALEMFAAHILPDGTDAKC